MPNPFPLAWASTLKPPYSSEFTKLIMGHTPQFHPGSRQVLRLERIEER